MVGAFLPYIGAVAGYSLVLNQASAFSDPSKEVMFISRVGLNVTGDCGVHQIQVRVRANNDFLKYLMSGAGACGETTMFVTNSLNKIGLDAQYVEFPGEDHALTEVSINGTWMVVDPGYFNCTLILRTERAQIRIEKQEH